MNGVRRLRGLWCALKPAVPCGPSHFCTMRVSTLLSIVALALIPRGEARATYQRHARTTSDVCGDVDGPMKVVFLGVDVVVGPLDICLCLSGIPALLTSNIVVKTAVGLVGGPAVTSVLTNMVNSAADHESCLYPDNATPFCSSGSPCGFGCKNGFVPSPSPPFAPKDCICPFPLKVCNGFCGPFKVCPSSGPKKRDLDSRTLCGAGHTACGVYGFHSADAFECIDTKTDLESCGGCTVPFGSNPARGFDCTAIPGVMDVACLAGQCIVRRCQPGYVLSQDNSFCLHSDTAAKIQSGDVPAALFGLEHVPLKKKAE